MTLASFTEPLRTYRPGPAAWLLLMLAGALIVALAILGPDRLIAQIQGERGIPPIASTEDIQVTGVEVNVTGKTAKEARENGWKLAQRKAWEQINGPKMSDEQIDAMVSAIVIENEQIGPGRYVARLGVVFDRSRATRFLSAGEGGQVARSAPLLVVPVLYSGGVRQVFEVRGPWQRAWANFQTAVSPVDYVRPTGSGGESLILTAGQTERRSRIWWRSVLDQFDAADVIMPVARLERQWPGGPVHGEFTARYGPDNQYIDSFTLTANNQNELPQMLDQAVLRLDKIYRRALAEGLLTPDPTLMSGQEALDAAITELRAKLAPQIQAASEPPAAVQLPTPQPSEAPSPAAIATYTVQFASPNAAAIDSALAAVRAASGVQSAATTSLAIGGTSVMRVRMIGDIEALASALRGQGWQVTVGADALMISR